MLKEKKLIMELDMDYIKIYFMAMRKLFNGQREY